MLHDANYSLLQLLGKSDDFDLINQLFANFCVGK
jgi:tRNA U34 5-carboxymethylaminomethyl modifying GTPase MnmE/TrmE